LIGVPETVMAGPPGTRVWPPTTNVPPEFAVIVCPPTVSTPPLPMIGTVLDPTTTAVPPGARLIGVPAVVMAGPPGETVWPPTAKPPAEFAVMVWPPAVRTVGVTLFPGDWAGVAGKLVVGCGSVVGD